MESIRSLKLIKGNVPETLVVPVGVRSITGLFGKDNKSLKSVILPIGLKAIGGDAFTNWAKANRHPFEYVSHEKSVGDLDADGCAPAKTPC